MRFARLRGLMASYLDLILDPTPLGAPWEWWGTPD